MRKIIAVSAGHDTIKKGKNPIREHIRYLNYGLLGLATMLHHKGNIDIVVFQADYLSVRELFETIEESGINIYNDCECFMLSIPSFYSVTWSAKFCETVKHTYGKKIIVGGRWVVDNKEIWIRNKLQYVDEVIEGFGERKIAQYFRFPGWENIADGSTQCFEWLDYELLYDFKKYQPCIEISRGCGSGCQFCADSNHRRLSNKSVDIIENELQNLDRVYGSYSVYFEAPHFIFERKWLSKLCNMIQNRKKSFHWRCTSRVESVPLDSLNIMHDAGLRVLDIGLESASERQLINMHKTPDPKRYLDMAEKLLIECYKNDIWVKFNLLLYAGETYDTIQETTEWLIDRKELIKDVSASNLVYYYNMDCINDLISLGASIPDGLRIDDLGYIDLNLSPEIDSHAAKSIAVQIPKQFASQKDFYDIKSISYFESSYSYDKFLDDISLCDLDMLPFTFIPDL